MPPSSPLTLTFLLFDGFSTMVLASAIEPLRAACDLSGQPLFRWRIATPDGAEAVSSSGLRLRPDGGEGDDPAADARRGLVVIAGYGVRRHHRSRTLRLVLRLARGAEPVAGFDTGAWLLAGAGLLDGRRATLHWMERESFAEAFPAVDTVAGRHVADGPFVTAGSAEGVLDWSLDLIGKQAGEALRFDVGTMFGRSSGKPVPTPGEVAPGVLELGGPEVLTLREIVGQVLDEINRRRLVVNLPFWLGGLVGRVFDLAQSATGGLLTNRIVTRDQVRQLRVDNVVAAGSRGFDELGIVPVAAPAVIGDYLWRFRRGGQYAGAGAPVRNQPRP